MSPIWIKYATIKYMNKLQIILFKIRIIILFGGLQEKLRKGVGHELLGPALLKCLLRVLFVKRITKKVSIKYFFYI